jgi:cell division protein FtsB
MLKTDPQFLELKARDHLDLAKEGEVIFRFEQEK